MFFNLNKGLKGLDIVAQECSFWLEAWGSELHSSTQKKKKKFKQLLLLQLDISILTWQCEWKHFVIYKVLCTSEEQGCVTLSCFLTSVPRHGSRQGLSLLGPQVEITKPWAVLCLRPPSLSPWLGSEVSIIVTAPGGVTHRHRLHPWLPTGLDQVSSKEVSLKNGKFFWLLLLSSVKLIQ